MLKAQNDAKRQTLIFTFTMWEIDYPWKVNASILSSSREVINLELLPLGLGSWLFLRVILFQ